MKVLYTRISSVDQKTDRQRITEKDFDMVIEDKCSGSIPFFEREGGKEVLEYLKKGYKCKEAALLADVHHNTVTKIRKLGFLNGCVVAV